MGAVSENSQRTSPFDQEGGAIPQEALGAAADATGTRSKRTLPPRITVIEAAHRPRERNVEFVAGRGVIVPPMGGR